MRLDKFLKVARLIKRRTVANEACDFGKVEVNGRAVKPSYSVTPGDIIAITFGERTTRVQVLNVADHIGKADAASLYQVLE